MTGRKKTVLAGIAAVVVIWGSRVAWEDHLARQSATRREAAYQTALVSARRDIPLGTLPGELRAFAEARGLELAEAQFNEPNVYELLIPLGKEPSPRWFCSYEGVYLEFKFPRVISGADRGAAGPLQSTAILHWMRDCL